MQLKNLNNLKRNTKNTLKAFSLLETIISITIIAVVMIMLNTVVLNLTIVSQKSLARSTVRDEVTAVATRIVNDIRNADSVINCAGSSCTVYGEQSGTWQLCGSAICKRDLNGNETYSTISNVQINAFNIDRGFAQTNNSIQSNFLITVVGSHTNSNYNVTNVIRQVAAATRNYSF